MSLYEITFIVRQDVSATEVERITSGITGAIQASDGKILKHEYWGLRNLAYEIKSNKKGHYVMLVIDAPNKALEDFRKKIKLSENILRNVVIKLDKFDGKSSIMMTQPEESTIRKTVNY